MGSIREGAWSDPRTLGFVTSLVTFLAAGRGRLGAAALGLVQIQVWSCLSGEPGDGVGERIAVLAATRDAAFRDGCRRAFDLIRQLDPESVSAQVAADATELADLAEEDIAVLGRILATRLRSEDLRALDLWADAFEPLALFEELRT